MDTHTVLNTGILMLSPATSKNTCWNLVFNIIYIKAFLSRQCIKQNLIISPGHNMGSKVNGVKIHEGRVSVICRSFPD